MKWLVALVIFSICSLAFGDLKSQRTRVLKLFGHKTLKQIRFLHIPKTGTTFATTIVHYCCEQLNDTYIDVLIRLNSNVRMPWKNDKSCRKVLKQPKSKNGNWWAHIPYDRDVDKNIAITILRDPGPRLASQLIHMKAIGGRMTTFGIATEYVSMAIYAFQNKFSNILSLQDNSAIVRKNLAPFLSKIRQCQLIQEELSSRDTIARQKLDQCKWIAVALLPGMLGCQTKMILGRECGEDHDLTEADRLEASRRLRQEFAFVGMQHDWSNSVKLFHQLYGGGLYEEELQRRRAGGKDRLRHVVEAAVQQVPDPWDSRLFAEAVASYTALIGEQAEHWNQTLPGEDVATAFAVIPEI